VLVVLVVVLAVVFEWHRIALMVLALGYLISGVVARVGYSWQRRFARP
jgi:hypothetical protein